MNDIKEAKKLDCALLDPARLENVEAVGWSEGS